MQINIQSDGLPIYQQIANQIRYRIAARNLKPGDEVPSIRSLAESLRVNPNTVARAYRELETEGMLEKRRTKGTYVAKQDHQQSIRQRAQQLEPHLDTLIMYAVQLGLSLDHVTEQLRERIEVLEKRRTKNKEDLA